MKTDFDRAILCDHELVEQEEEAAREVFLHRVHRPGGVHDAITTALDSFFMSVTMWRYVRSSSWKGKRVRWSSGPRRVANCRFILARTVRRLSRRTRIPTWRYPFAAAQALGFDFTQFLAFQVGKLEIFEHDVDQFFQGHVGLVVVDAGLVAGLAGSRCLRLLPVRSSAPAVRRPVPGPLRAHSRRR